METIYWYVVASIVALLPIYLIKQYTVDKNMNYLLLTMVLYLVLMIAYIQIFGQHQVSTSYTVLQIAQILIVCLIGILLYGEPITWRVVVGLISGTLSIYLLTG